MDGSDATSSFILLHVAILSQYRRQSQILRSVGASRTQPVSIFLGGVSARDSGTVLGQILSFSDREKEDELGRMKQMY